MDGRLVAVATDGHRLARNYGPENGGGWEGIIIPRKTVSILPKGNVKVRLSANKIQFATADTVITSKLIDGTFPDYQRVIPTGNDKIVTFDLPAMKQAAERVSVISSERGRAVRLAIAENQIVLSVNNAEAGSATEEIAVAYDGEPIEIGFNAAYLTELVGQFPAGDVKMALNDSGSPTLFTSDKAEGLLAVLMPMRVN
jgi:DNA polymerase-3 subunit beta